MSIENKLEAGELSKKNAEAIWSSLRDSIKQIQNGGASKLKFEEIYRHGYTLVLHKYGDMEYEGIQKCIMEQLAEINKTISDANPDHLLEIFAKEWNEFKLKNTMIKDCVMYMNKTYCKTNDKKPADDLGVHLFREQVICSAVICDKIKKIMMKNILNDRNGELIDKMVMKSVVNMLWETGSYQNVFENEFFRQTREFYINESMYYLSNNTCSDYLKKVEERFGQEDKRVDVYLHESSLKKMRDILDEELIVKYAKQLVDDPKTGCEPMLKNEITDGLSRMYKLFSRKPETHELIRANMNALIRKMGVDIVKDQENLKNPQKFIKEILNLQEKFDEIIKKCFQNDRTFCFSQKNALEYFINMDHHVAEYLSLFLDDLFRNRATTIVEVEKKLDNIIVIYKFIHDKDIFENFYKRHLASRLLTNSCANGEFEKMLISKLTAESGRSFTSRLETMFTDIELSKKIMQDYKRSNELSVTILQSGLWPMKAEDKAKIPSEIQHLTNDFVLYYSKVHKGRKLTWCLNSGTAELRCQFAKGVRELIVTTYQMFILLLFNKSEKYTYKQIHDFTGIPDEELENNILSLAHPKVNVLSKKPNTKELADNHVFIWNPNYTNPLKKVKIPLMTIKKSQETKPEIPASVLEERRTRTDAGIVRIMKARKVLQHKDLIAEVIKQLSGKFAVEIPLIKKRIDVMIEQEYIERDAENRNLYHYKA